MIGDTHFIVDMHRQFAEKIWQPFSSHSSNEPWVISIAGESGSGKTGATLALAEKMHAAGKSYFILHQDDYFKLPPKSNHQKREQDLAWVGPQEVRLDLMDEHLVQLQSPSPQPFTKPLIHYKDNRIDEEWVIPQKFDVLLVEGAYVTLLKEPHFRVFIDQTYEQTRTGRQLRGREEESEFIETVLAIEHQEISKHKHLADLVLVP